MGERWGTVGLGEVDSPEPAPHLNSNLWSVGGWVKPFVGGRIDGQNIEEVFGVRSV